MIASPSNTIGATWVCHNFPATLPENELRSGWVTLENNGERTWEPGSFRIHASLDGQLVAQIEIPQIVHPGERVSVSWIFRTITALGPHEFTFAAVENDGESGAGSSEVLRVPVTIAANERTQTAQLRDNVLESHARCWLPCDGISWSSTGPGYPHFALEARGCRTTDVEGRQFVDYLMGWGSALLGYADPRIQQAIVAALQSGPMITLTHTLMPEVADLLRAFFPSAEAVTFGKNGSDVCTAAVRMARVHTSRPIVLFCGYHGWQDWYVERLGFEATGVPTRSEPLLHQFAAGNLEQLRELFARYRGQVAAVLLEPAGVLESLSGPVKEADADFLQAMIDLAHGEGALVIFDEIITGFRYRGGSVQHATRTRPDLTCLGKALSAGMPLAALMGRRDVFDTSIGRISYEPTFKGEMYSLAAAREALGIYRAEDIPSRIWNFGERLRQTFHHACKGAEVAARLIGPPFRMLVAFDEPNAHRRTLMRTLLQQELLKAGVLTTKNLFLPSVAHDDIALDETRAAFDQALQVVAEASATDRFAAYLEIPALPG
ncbi:MAG TPA: aminotransferase class III-fold pyridoxal phosphate-dependent enzyme [Chthoniobacterales bacterium]|nr:aminotransferase class III-fold pyridoxal phosphate-dependent enzyme [Chthoniobacterales bacterium]